jgi:hypothetical protein
VFEPPRSSAEASETFTARAPRSAARRRRARPWDARFDLVYMLEPDDRVRDSRFRAELQCAVGDVVRKVATR